VSVEGGVGDEHAQRVPVEHQPGLVPVRAEPFNALAQPAHMSGQQKQKQKINNKYLCNKTISHYFYIILF
jgi:hypothetical protein